MAAVVNVNGRICGEHEAVVSVFDHGFVFGEGVYEVLRTYHREPFLLEAHLRRMRESAAMIALDVPLGDPELTAQIRLTLDAAPGLDEAYIRVLLTRGVGEFSYDPGSCPTPTLVVVVKPHVPPPPEVYERGVRIALVGVTRNHPGSVSPRIKSNNLLNNVLAMQQAIRRGAFEALMKNYRGELCECSQSNFFIVRGGEAVTPPLDAGLLAGVTRAFVFELGREVGVPVRETVLHESDLQGATEAFLTSTTREIVPIVTVDDRRVGDGTPGPVTRRLLRAFRERTAAPPGLAAPVEDVTVLRSC
jgi:branched-chain amino acid aminotransferase